jgi:hypothetical protein
MPAKKATPAAKKVPPASTRVWLTYPTKLIKRAVIWELGHKFDLVTNVRQASVSDEVGILCLELEGPGPEIEAGLKWLKKLGVSVEPVEMNAIAG